MARRPRFGLIMGGVLALTALVFTAARAQNPPSPDLDPRIITAAKQGDGRAVRARLKADPAALNATDKSGRTALHWAAEYGYTNVVRIVLAAGARIDRPEGSLLRTALHLAALNGRANTVRFLLAKGAAVAARDKFGGTPLHLAAWSCHGSVVKLLLAKGADPDRKNLQGRSALDLADDGHCPTVSRMLLRHPRR